MTASLMYYQYGGHAHPDGEVNLVNVEVRALKNERNQTWGKQVVHHISGELIYSTQATIKDAIDAMEKAYSVNNNSAGLYHTDGTPTPHVLDMTHPDMASGVQVDYRSFPRDGPDEYATVRSFYIRLSAIFFDPDSQIQGFRESVSVHGTGEPVWRWAKAWLPNGTPVHVQQQISPATTQVIRQWGWITGLATWPIAQAPLWPKWEHKDRRVIEQLAPRWQGAAYSHYTRSWNYVFETPPGSTVTPNTY